MADGMTGPRGPEAPRGHAQEAERADVRPRLLRMVYREHPSKTVRLVAGELILHPRAAEADCTLWVGLKDGPDEWEGILGAWVSERDAEVVGIPVFAYDLNLGDVVRVIRSAEGAPVISELITRSSNSTFRALFDRELHVGEHWKRLMEDLEPFGCWFDTWSETLVAISVAATNARSVADCLKIKESAAELKYETGRTE
jgi:hypothetical protein